MNIPALPASFLTVPITHRGLHDISDARPENSLAAFQGAIDGGYGIELDLQLSSDGQAMVFHDYFLQRLTAQSGPVAQRSAAELKEIKLLHTPVLNSPDSYIPTLPEVLALVAGKVPLLIELKDQDGGLGANIGQLEAATVQAIEGYQGDIALMSFNPHSVSKLAELAPQVPRGLTTCDFLKQDWPTVPLSRLEELRPIPDYQRSKSSFISHQEDDLENPHVAALKAQNTPVLCWTIRSPESEAKAREVADNVTFEGYIPASKARLAP